MNSWSPLGVQGIEEKRNLPLGGELRGHLEGLFCTVSPVPKYTLRVASELTPPPRVGYAFLQYLALQGGPRNSPVWATLTQNGQKALKKGVTPQINGADPLLSQKNRRR